MTTFVTVHNVQAYYTWYADRATCLSGTLFIHDYTLQCQHVKFIYSILLFPPKKKIIFSWRVTIVVPDPFHRLVCFLRLRHFVEFVGWHRSPVCMSNQHNGYIYLCPIPNNFCHSFNYLCDGIQVFVDLFKTWKEMPTFTNVNDSDRMLLLMVLNQTFTL